MSTEQEFEIRKKIFESFTKKNLKKLKFSYSLPRINLIKKIMRNIAPIITHIIGIP